MSYKHLKAIPFEISFMNLTFFFQNPLAKKIGQTYVQIIQKSNTRPIFKVH